MGRAGDCAGVSRERGKIERGREMVGRRGECIEGDVFFRKVKREDDTDLKVHPRAPHVFYVHAVWHF